MESSETPPSREFASPWVRLRSATPHPFIYQRMIGEADPSARPGDVVAIYDRQGRFFGRGLFNPRSQIAIRVLTRSEMPLSDDFWGDRLAQAISLRRRLGLDDITDAYRLVHAEGDQLSGLIIERYADCLAFEFFSLGMFQRRDLIAAAIQRALGRPTALDRGGRAGPEWRVVFRADESVERIEGFAAPQPQAPVEVVIRENGVRYRVDVTGGQKTGFFCDQRDNRLRFAKLCRSGSVLDLCCYTGGFGLTARKLGGASDVISVDLDEKSLAIARENANLNQARVTFVHADVFNYLRQMLANQRLFDSVVLDPPKLARSRGELEEAMIRYNDMNSLALQAVRPGGIFLTCSCSGLVSADEFETMVFRAARRAQRTVQVFDRTGAAADHPIMPECAESAYLKALWLRVL